MTKFIYIADSHLGANPMGYHQQKGYPEKLPDILAALKEYINTEGNIDFILHGGDMIDAARDDNIITAAANFDFPVPVHLCLGNHDLTIPDALEPWLKGAPDFFNQTGKPEYSIASKDCVIHITPNHWEDKPYFWGDTQQARFSKDQITYLSEKLSSNPHIPHIVLTHSSVFGLPPEQTGFEEPYHTPDASFTAEITALAKKHPNIKLILGAHNHMNMRASHEGVEYITVSALTETPFEFKLFEINRDAITMSTLSLSTALSWEGEYDAERTYVQGRPVDRSFSYKLPV